MAKTAKLFKNGRSQAVRLPAEFRFEGEEVFIRKDEKTGDVVLSRRPESSDPFFRLRDEAMEMDRRAFEEFHSGLGTVIPCASRDCVRFEAEVRDLAAELRAVAKTAGGELSRA